MTLLYGTGRERNTIPPYYSSYPFVYISGQSPLPIGFTAFGIVPIRGRLVFIPANSRYTNRHVAYANTVYLTHIRQHAYKYLLTGYMFVCYCPSRSMLLTNSPGNNMKELITDYPEDQQAIILAGYESQRTGKDRDDNPYVIDGELWQLWDFGYSLAFLSE